MTNKNDSADEDNCVREGGNEVSNKINSKINADYDANYNDMELRDTAVLKK